MIQLATVTHFTDLNTSVQPGSTAFTQECLHWESGGEEAAGGMVVSNKEKALYVEKSSRGYCVGTAIAYETRGELWIMHKHESAAK